MIVEDLKWWLKLNQQNPELLTGGCVCGQVRYTLTQAPIFVHCCHCTWCQRESGAAFAINAMLESSAIEVTGQPVLVDTPSASGRGQKIARCATCQVAVWSHYSGMGELLSFVKVGTLDEPDAAPPDIHIYTESKQPWVELPSDKPVFEQYYDAKSWWPDSAMERFVALKKMRPAHD